MFLSVNNITIIPVTQALHCLPDISHLSFIPPPSSSRSPHPKGQMMASNVCQQQAPRTTWLLNPMDTVQLLSYLTFQLHSEEPTIPFLKYNPSLGSMTHSFLAFTLLCWQHLLAPFACPFLHCSCSHGLG